jgi:hypothetical protein
MRDRSPTTNHNCLGKNLFTAGSLAFVSSAHVKSIVQSVLKLKLASVNHSKFDWSDLVCPKHHINPFHLSILDRIWRADLAAVGLSVLKLKLAMDCFFFPLVTSCMLSPFTALFYRDSVIRVRMRFHNAISKLDHEVVVYPCRR